MRKNTKRKNTAEKNRQALIDATLEAIAELGIAGCSVSEIVQRAGLSRGMIHLHFDGKENLLIAAVQQTGENYYAHLDSVLAGSGGLPQHRIAAIIHCDLSETILNKRTVNIWYAFRGEARERGAIAKFTDTRDKRLNQLIFKAFRIIAETEGQANTNAVARDATNGVLAMLEGFWTDYLLHPDAFNRKNARQIVFRFLAGLFPLHFSLLGPESNESAV